MATFEVTGVLSQIEGGDAQAAEKLLPLVYDELRKLAAASTLVGVSALVGADWLIEFEATAIVAE